MSSVPQLVTHLPSLELGRVVVSDDRLYLILCWERFNNQGYADEGQRIPPAWVHVEEIDVLNPTCIVCIGMRYDVP